MHSQKQSFLTVPLLSALSEAQNCASLWEAKKYQLVFHHRFRFSLSFWITFPKILPVMGTAADSIPAGASEPSAWFTLQLPLPRTSLGQFKERNDGEISTSTPVLACHLSLKHTQHNSNAEPASDTSLISIVLAVLLWIFPLWNHSFFSQDTHWNLKLFLLQLFEIILSYLITSKHSWNGWL